VIALDVNTSSGLFIIIAACIACLFFGICFRMAFIARQKRSKEHSHDDDEF